MSGSERTIDLAVRVWLGIAPLSEVQDWVDARLAEVARADDLLLALAENRHREREQIAADLIESVGELDRDVCTHRMILALERAFEAHAITLEQLAAFLIGQMWDRLAAIDELGAAHGIDDAIAFAESSIYAGARDAAIAHARALFARSRARLGRS